MSYVNGDLFRLISEILVEMSYYRIDGIEIDKDNYVYTVDEGKRNDFICTQLKDEDIETIKQVCKTLNIPITNK